VKLNPEDQTIAAALAQAPLDEANERGAKARIEFLRDGYAKGDHNDFGRVGNEGDQARLVDWRTLCRGSPNIRPRALGIEALGKARRRAA
jgi:hypothetical protein